MKQYNAIESVNGVRINLAENNMNGDLIGAWVDLMSSSRAYIINKVKDAAMKKLQVIADFYSQILEEEVSVKKTLRLINAQMAFLALIIPAAMPILYYVAVLAWLGIALKR